MHKSESQFRLINSILGEDLIDPLNYNEVSFQKQEWDNIPMVIPRFCLHLQKHVESLTSHYRERCEMEPDPLARAKMIDDLRSGLREQHSHNGHLAKDVAEMNSKIAGMKDIVNQLHDLYKSEKDSQKDGANAPLSHLVLEDERDVAKVKFEAAEYLALSPFRFEDAPLPTEILAPRTFSIK